MRPSDLTFWGQETLPEWAATLARQVQPGGAQAPPEVLSPVPLLEELLSIINGMSRGQEAPKSHDRSSLRDDLKLACDQLGEAVSRLHAQTLRAFRAQVGNLDSTLATVAGAQAIAPLANVLLAALASPASRAAAFDDAVAAFRDLAHVDTCELRLRQLRSFVVRAGHHWDERAKLIVEALGDRVSARTAAGAEPPEHPSAYLRPAGMSLEERLALAKGLVEAEPRFVDATVWLAYANATVEPFYLQKGPLEFYDGRIWDIARSGHWPGNPRWTQPVELADPGADIHLGGDINGLPASDFVMVRVSLTGVRATEAAERARGLADAALALTGWESRWRALQGEPIYTTHWFGSVGFLDPQLLVHAPPAFDPVTTELAAGSDDLIVRLAANEQAVTELVDDVRWRRDARAARSTDHRVALLVTLIERVLPSSSPQGADWYEVASYYLRTLLAFDDLSRRVCEAGETAVHTRISAEHVNPFPYRAEIVEHHGRNAFRVHPDRILERIDDLLAFTTPETMEARMLAEVESRMSDGPAAIAWLAECERRFDRLLARSRRQRNAIAHGTRTITEVVSSIEPFLDSVAGRGIGALQWTVEQHADLPTQLEAWKIDWEERKASLAAGGLPGLLFA